MREKKSDTGYQKPPPGEWFTQCEGVLGDERHIGLYFIAEGFRYGANGSKEKGAILAVDWIIGDDFYTATLFKTEDGRSVFLRNSVSHMLGKEPKSVFEHLGAPAYSSRDPILNAHSLAAGIAWSCAGRMQEASEEIFPLVERFLADYYDSEILRTKVGRPITGREYEFLQANPARRQAAEAMPWILPYVALNFGTEGVTEIMRTIDGCEELVPALGRRFGVVPNVIRSMSVFPAWSPNAFRLGELLSVDAPTIALVLSQIPPEQRPDKDRVKKFMEVIAWVETVLREAGDQASRTLVAAASAEVWKRLHRRPYSLPTYAEVSWLFDLATAVSEFPNVEPKPAEGEILGKKKSFMPQVWAVAYMLCRYHPTDLAALGRDWNRREMAYVRHHVRESFPETFPIESYFPDSFVASNGWKIRRITTVGELCDESAAASNCLAGYLAALIRRDSAIFCLVDPLANTEGHFSLEPGEEDQLSIGQVRRYRNRKALPQMNEAAKEFLELTRKEFGSDYPPPLKNRAAKKAGMMLAVTAVDGAKAIAHMKTVEEILKKTAERFSINRPAKENMQ